MHERDLKIAMTGPRLASQRLGTAPRRLALGATLALMLALLLAPAAMAKDETFGYSSGESITGTMCGESQTCTAHVYEGGQYTAPVTGWITEFTVDHSIEGGAGQTVRLLVVKSDTETVEAVSPAKPLSLTEKIQTFHLSESEQPHIERGQTLEVTVTPAAGEKADSVIAQGSGDVDECTSGPTNKGEKIAQCGGLGSSIHVSSTDAVSAHIEDEVRPPEVVSYSSATNITATSAELHARIKPNDPEGHATVARFEYGTVANNLNQSSPEEPVGSGEAGKQDEVNLSIPGLAPNTTYYYRVGVSNYETATNSGWAYEYGAGSNEEVRSFTTPPAPSPTVALSAATNVGETTATLNGTVASNGLATKWKFEYGESQGYGAATAEGEVGSASGGTPQGASVNVAGLKPNTLYHYRIIATNPGGTTPSGDGTFRTAAGKPPVVGAFVFSPLTPLSAYEVNLHFTVDPQGYATTFIVQWGTSTAYGNNDSGGPTAAVFGPQAYFWDAEYELTPGTTYHVRVVATNQWGTTAGPDFTFTTPQLTTTFLVEEFGMAPNNSTVTVNPAKPVLVLGKKFSCPPACSVTAEVEAVGKGKKKIKLGKAKFKVPKDKRKHKLEVKLPKKAKKLLAKNKKLHLKVKYKIANAKGKSTTLVSSLTLSAHKSHKGHRTGHKH